MEPTLPLAAASVFFDGTFSEPRLQHPEGLAVAADGAIWCGSETGGIHRIAPDGSGIETVATTGGFILGIAFDSSDRLYCCDLKEAAVYRLDTRSGELERFSGDAAMRIPNYPVVDERRGVLYVSDSYAPSEPGPGIWRFGLDGGEGELWWPSPLVFANGMALDPTGELLYVIESFARRIVQFPIRDDGSAGPPEVVVEGLYSVPDGLAVGTDGSLYVSCYEPSRIYRVTPQRELTLLIDDPEAHLLCHPTNCAFRGDELFTANLGRWHITRIDVAAEGVPLPGARS